MKKDTVNIITIGLKLTLICAVAALVLGAVNFLTAPRIQMLKEKDLQEKLAQVALGGAIGKEVQVRDHPVVRSYYPLKLEDGQKGYILKLQGVGYGGAMDLLASYKENGEILSAVLVEDNETPGLGKEAEKPGYMKKFIGTGGDKPVPVSKAMLAASQGNSGGVSKQSVSPFNLFTWFFGKTTGGNVDSISGVTITFMGVSKALAAGSKFVKGLGA